MHLTRRSDAAVVVAYRFAEPLDEPDHRLKPAIFITHNVVASTNTADERITCKVLFDQFEPSSARRRIIIEKGYDLCVDRFDGGIECGDLSRNGNFKHGQRQNGRCSASKVRFSFGVAIPSNYNYVLWCSRLLLERREAAREIAGALIRWYDDGDSRHHEDP